VAATLIGLVDRVARRLRAAHRVCRTVVLRLRFADYSRATRSRTMAEPTARTDTILAVANQLLALAAPTIDTRGLTLVGVALTNLADEVPIQLSLTAQRALELDATLDRLRDRFGAAAITRGALIGMPEEPTVPLLPD
jgi:DNA polymerase-4